MKKCPYCGDQNPDENNICSSCGRSLGVSNVNYEVSREYDRFMGHPMKWYKFLIYFDLIATAVYDIIIGILRITGLIYTTSYQMTSIAYEDTLRELPQVRTLDMIVGICCFVIAAALCFTQVKLLKLKKDGPMWLYITSAFAIAVNVVTVALTGAWSSVQGVHVKYDFLRFNVSLQIEILISAVILILTIVYFHKRRDVFVN